MEGLCLTLIESKAKVLLILIFLSSLVGVGCHIWLTRKLAFVNFEEDRPAKKEKLRLFFPLGMVVVICFLLPIIMIGTSADLNDCLSVPDVRMYVLFPWNVIMPAIGWGTTLLADSALGAAFYWVIGLMLWFFTHKMRR